MERRLLLSELPEDIIYHILSYLSNQGAIRLSLASKPLSSLVKKRPNLDFRHLNKGKCVKKYNQELKYIVSTLRKNQREKIQLETLTLQPVYARKLLHDQCITFAAKNGVRNLNLWMDTSSRVYALPKPIFEVESLVELELKNCHLEPERSIMWPNLKRLSITKRVVPVYQEVFDNIIKGCPKIENLRIDSLCCNAKVANLHNLKQLDLKFVGNKQCLEVINAPNLESMACHAHSGVVDLGDDEYPNLKSLELHFGRIDEHFLTNFARKFSRLENLYLECSPTLQRINLSSASLKEIKLTAGYDLEEACIDVPNLVCFEYYGKIIPKLSFAGNSGRWISRIELFESRVKLDASWFRELIEFLASLNKSEITITVKLIYKSVLLNHEERRIIANSVTPIQGIREFSMNTNWSTPSSNASAFLDCILLICQPRTITFLNCKKYNIPWHFYNNLTSRSSRDCGGVIDFEMLQRSSKREEESRLSGGFKNWDSEVWRVLLNDQKDFIFHLEYRTEILHIEKKRKLF